MASMTDQRVQKPFDALMKSCFLGQLRAVIQQYLWSNHAMIWYQISLKRSDGFVSLKTKISIFEAGPPLQGLDAVDASAGNRAPAVNKAIWFSSYSISELVSEVICKNRLYRHREVWSGLDRFRFQRGLFLWYSLASRIPYNSSEYRSTKIATGEHEET